MRLETTNNPAPLTLYLNLPSFSQIGKGTKFSQILIQILLHMRDDLRNLELCKKMGRRMMLPFDFNNPKKNEKKSVFFN